MKKIKLILKILFPSQEEMEKREFEKFMKGVNDRYDIEYRHRMWDKGYRNKNCI